MQKNRNFISNIVFLGFFFFFSSSCRVDEIVTRHPLESLNPFDSIMNKESEYMVVLGDLQYYTLIENNALFAKTVHWIYSQKEQGAKIKCVLQVGDITENNNPIQWRNYKKGIGKVEKSIPLILCTGNHDYSWDSTNKIPNRNSTNLNLFVDYELSKLNVVNRFEVGKNENVVVRTIVKEEEFYILSLEFGPRDEVIEWANKIVKEYSSKRFLLLNHEYLSNKGVRISANSYAEKQLVNTTRNNPEQLWIKLINQNSNIIAVLSGHNCFTHLLLSKNSIGDTVPQIQFDPQCEPNGGDGWIQFWEFPNNKDSVTVRTYNISRKEILYNDNSYFKFKLNI